MIFNPNSANVRGTDNDKIAESPRHPARAIWQPTLLNPMGLNTLRRIRIFRTGDLTARSFRPYGIDISRMGDLTTHSFKPLRIEDSTENSLALASPVRAVWLSLRGFKHRLIKLFYLLSKNE